jgi:hypothetical protein
MRHRRPCPAGVVATHEGQHRVVWRGQFQGSIRRCPLLAGRRRRAAILHQRRARDGPVTLHHITFRAAHPSTITYHADLDCRGRIACRPEQIQRQPCGHEIGRPALLFECPRGQTDHGRSVEVIISPVALGKAGRHELATLRQREMRRFHCHSNIVARRFAWLSFGSPNPLLEIDLDNRAVRPQGAVAHAPELLAASIDSCTCGIHTALPARTTN